MPKSCQKPSGLYYISGVLIQSRPVMYHLQEFERRLLISLGSTYRAMQSFLVTEFLLFDNFIHQ